MAWIRALAIGGSFLAAGVAAGCKDVTPSSTEITITVVSPGNGALAGGTSVTITGTNFSETRVMLRERCCVTNVAADKHSSDAATPQWW